LSPDPSLSFLTRLAWMGAIWGLSVLSLGLVTAGIRFWLKA